MANKNAGRDDVISTLGWIVILILLIIPIVGLVVYIIWAFGKGNLNRRNYARASLILMLAGIILSVVFGVAFYALFQNAIGPLMGIFG